MKTPILLRESLKNAIPCTYCGNCREYCPIFQTMKIESASPRGKMILIYLLTSGMLKPSREAIEKFYLCTSCDACINACVSGLEVPKIIEHAKSEVVVVEPKFISTQISRIFKNTYAYGNPFGIGRAKRFNWAEGLNIQSPQKGNIKTLLFTCCILCYEPELQSIARYTALTLRKCGVVFANLGKEEICCGDHILRLGEKGLFEELAKQNISLFEKYGIEEIITISPHCYYVFKREKPYTEMEITAKHYTEVLTQLLESDKLKFRRTVEKTVAFHDPCFLGRKSGIYDEPRKILEAIPGVNLIEMKRNRENSFCCGGGAGRIWIEEAPPEQRPSINRIKEALELGVELLVVACPFCKYMLNDAVSTLGVGDRVIVKDLVEVVAESLNLH